MKLSFLHGMTEGQFNLVAARNNNARKSGRCIKEKAGVIVAASSIL